MKTKNILSTLSFFYIIILLNLCVFAQEFPVSVGPAPFVYNEGPVPEVFYQDHPGHNGFSFHATSISSSTLQKYDLGVPGTRTSIGPSHSYFFGGADFAPFGGMGTNYVLYTAQQLSPYNFFIIDTTTGAETSLPNVTGLTQANLTGMTWDITTSTMFAVTTSVSASQLYSLNLTTGVATTIGSQQTTAPAIIGIACAPNGTLFAYDITNDAAYRINKTTGAATLIGPLGFNASFGQDCDFDAITGTWYLACYETGVGPQLRTCDTTTGTATLVGAFTGATQMIGTGIPAPFQSLNYALSLPTPGVNTNYVLIPFQSSMVGFQNITIEGWVKIGSLATINTVLNKGAGSYDYQLGINAGTTNPYFRAQGVIVTANTITVTPGTWTHLAVTYDGTTVRFYKDGALGYSQVQAAPLGASTNEMRIGRGNTEPGSGNLEEVRLWTVARTQQQLDSNKCRKERSSFTSSGGLLALWHFDNNYTESISSYNGTPFGSIGFDTVSYPLPGANCTLVGIIHSGNEIPSNYSLEQNYPNPFNPITRIKFGIPQFPSDVHPRGERGLFTQLKIFDLLGREISILVNEQLKPGTYEVAWNASNYPSGIYFYKLTTGEFSETRKAVLIK